MDWERDALLIRKHFHVDPATLTLGQYAGMLKLAWGVEYQEPRTK